MSFWKKLIQKFTPSAGAAVDWEPLFIEADLGLPLTEKWMEGLKRQKLDRDPVAAEAWLKGQLRDLVQVGPENFSGNLSVEGRIPEKKPEVILLVGVNGSGKTTTAAKLARMAQKRGKRVVLGAADTFRAAAVDQLQAWGERLKVPVVTAAAGSDPASVAFRSYEAAEKAEADLLIVDTAGRLPNKNNLMLEIAKVKRVLEKKSASAPHHVWLVVDGTTGGNIMGQAREFHGALSLTGMIMTKLDGSAKGGMVAAVREELGIPTVYLGRGEQVEDLEPFNAERYVAEFFAD
jgi:fused signal recognition particle receptor